MNSYKGAVTGGVKYRSVDIITIRVRPVKHYELLPVFGACLHNVTHGGQVCVKPGPHILDVKYNDIYVSEIFRCRLLFRGIEAYDFDARHRVGSRGDHRTIVGQVPEAMFRSKDQPDVDAFR